MDDSELARTIRRLRRQGTDDARCEAKESTRSLSKDVWETVSAFANTSGGTIILGLSESRGFSPVSGFEVDRVRDQLLAGMGDGGTGARIANPPHYQIERHEFEGSPLLVVKVDELDLSAKPCYIVNRGVQGGSYKRVDDADIPLSANEIYSLQTADVITDSDRAEVPGATVSDLDDAVVREMLGRAEELAPRALRGTSGDYEKLVRLNLADGRGGVTKAGVLAAGSYPQQFYPKLCVDVAVHSGLRKGGTDGVRFLDRAVCEGTIGEMIEQAVSAVARNLRRRSIVRGIGRVDELEIPEEVLREAIANALIHREYDRRFDGQAVSVDVFDDHVEVVNPGGLWGKSRDALADGRSCCRNATLMRMMSLVQLPGGAGAPAEGNGSGIPFMMSELLSRGLEPPEFRPSFDHFKVILRRPGQMHGEPESRETVRSLLELHGELSARELSEMSGLTLNQVRGRLRKMITSGDVEATAPATSRKRKYRLRG